MSTPPTAPVTGKNAAGENVVIEIPIPDANNAAAWNEAMLTTAAKEGVQIEGVTEKPAAAAATELKKPEGDQPTLYEFPVTVNGKTIVLKDEDPKNLLKQVAATLEGAQAAPAPAAAAVDEKKEGLSAADMFEIGTKLIGGDASGLDTLLQKSGAFERYLESQGVSISALKAATQKTQSDTVFSALTTAKDQFIEKVKAGEIDFPGGAQNEKMMGIMLARVQAEDIKAGKTGEFTLDTLVRAYDLMKQEGLVFKVDPNEKKQDPPPGKKKEAPGSTAIGTSGGGRETQTQQQATTRPKIELDMTQMSSQQFSAAYNLAIDQGYKENVDLFIKQ